eukprot:UN08318
MHVVLVFVVFLMVIYMHHHNKLFTIILILLQHIGIIIKYQKMLLQKQLQYHVPSWYISQFTRTSISLVVRFRLFW